MQCILYINIFTLIRLTEYYFSWGGIKWQMYARNRYTKNPRIHVRSHLFVIYLCNTHNTIYILYIRVHIISYIIIYIYIYTYDARSACYGKHKTCSHAFAPLFDCAVLVRMTRAFTKSFRWDDSISAVYKKIERTHWNRHKLLVYISKSFCNAVSRFMLSKR